MVFLCCYIVIAVVAVNSQPGEKRQKSNGWLMVTLKYLHRSVHRKKRGHLEQLPCHQDSNEYRRIYNRNSQHEIPALEHALQARMN